MRFLESDGDARLVAYVTLEEGRALRATALRAHLKRLVPDSMIPSSFVLLEELPRTVTGKVDRVALPIPARDRSAADSRYVAPRTPTEEVIVGIWQEVLGVSGLGVEDDFFELGGHSLTATQVVSRVREMFEIDLPLRTIFEEATPAALARALTIAAGEGGGVDETARLVVRLAATSEEEVTRLLEGKASDLDPGVAP